MRTKQLQQGGANGGDRMEWDSALGLWKPAAPAGSVFGMHFRSDYDTATYTHPPVTARVNQPILASLGNFHLTYGTFRIFYSVLIRHTSTNSEVDISFQDPTSSGTHLHHIRPRDVLNWLCVQRTMTIVADQTTSYNASMTLGTLDTSHDVQSKEARIETWQVA